MPEKGQTGRWLIFPVTLCVAMVGSYLVFSDLIKIAEIIFKGVPLKMYVNNCCSILTHDPDMLDPLNHHLLHIDCVPWLANMEVSKTIIRVLIGFISLFALICPFPSMALLLYHMVTIYMLDWCLTHVGVLIAHRNGLNLDSLPSHRKDEANKYFLFGELEWPASFWYNYSFTPIMQLYVAYQVRDLFYSWYLILTVGGSGWELMSANELPGWEKYEAELKAKEKGNFDIDEEAEGDLEKNQGNDQEPTQDEIIQFLQALQQGGGTGPPGGDAAILQELLRSLGNQQEGNDNEQDDEAQPMVTPFHINA